MRHLFVCFWLLRITKSAFSEVFTDGLFCYLMGGVPSGEKMVFDHLGIYLGAHPPKTTISFSPSTGVSRRRIDTPWMN